MLMVYGYHAYNYKRGEDLYIYAPKPELSMAENILMMLREDRQYTELEAKILDMAMVLHMDHGGGNNSTFTTHVCYIFRHRYIFYDRCSDGITERAETRRREHQSDTDVRGYEEKCRWTGQMMTR